MGHRLQALNARGSFVSYDKQDIITPGTRVSLSGVQGSPKIYVVKHVPKLNLLIVKEAGYTAYINRFDGSTYVPAQFKVFHYTEERKGDETHLLVDMFGVAEIPVTWTPPALPSE